MDVIREVDRLRGLDRLGDALVLLDRFVDERRGTQDPGVDRARAEAATLRAKLAERIADTLERANRLAAGGDREGAEELLAGVETWGDDVARHKARVLRETLNPR